MYLTSEPQVLVLYEIATLQLLLQAALSKVVLKFAASNVAGFPCR